MGYPIEMMECIGMVDAGKTMTLGDSEGDARWKNFNPLGKVLRV